jgi:hypothetical protein
MKWTKLMCLGAMAIFALVAIPAGLSGQEQGDKPKHHHYKLIDLGTFGGPASYVNFNTDVLNNRGTVVGSPIACAGLFSLKRTCLPPHYMSSGWLAEEFITQPSKRVDAAVLIPRLTSITRPSAFS